LLASAQPLKNSIAVASVKEDVTEPSVVRIEYGLPCLKGIGQVWADIVRPFVVIAR
jgi:hypothetical protein